MTIRLMVGLRNPGSEYQRTRHNAGAWLVEALAQSQRIGFSDDKKLQSALALINADSGPLRLVLPLTYMNHSGIAVRAVSQFYRFQPEEILIVHDELDIPAGELRLKQGGGHGGHNGLRDLISQLGSADFYRLRIGIGHPGHKQLVLDYVLGTPNAEDRQAIAAAIDHSLAVLPCLLEGQYAMATNRLNGFKGKSNGL